MDFGRITTAPCIDVVPPLDERCNDPAFRIANPELCQVGPRLILKPSVILLCELGSVQLSAVVIEDGVERDVTDETVFTSSNANVAVVGAASGNATGMSAGEANLTAAFEELTATAEITVLAGENCCDEINSAIMVLVDQTKSMSQSFGGSYTTKLAYAKAAATRFIDEINESKDVVGLLRFTEDSTVVLSSPVADNDAVASMVAGITQTQQNTKFYDALSDAIDELNALTVDQRVLLLISDGEDQSESYIEDNDPIALLGGFKAAGGIVICLGVRSHGPGYSLLSEFATGGFFLNAYSANAAEALDYLSGLKGYICGGNCAPAGDEYVATGTLNYCGFANWHVADGHVDLIGNGFLDVLPGNDLYVDMAGSQTVFKGKLIGKASIAVEAVKTYRLTVAIAGNQRLDAGPNSVEARVFSLNTPGVLTPTAAPVAVTVGSGSATTETWDYAVSYLNSEGETPFSPTDASGNGAFSSFTNTIGHSGDANATLARLWRKAFGSAVWHLIAESADVEVPTFTDSRDAAAFQTAIESGTIDACVQPTTVNTTGSKNVRISQTISINDFQQPFQDYSLSFTAGTSESVYISLQQIASPAGYDAIGLLVGSVSFDAVTDGGNLFNDTFENENLTYIPPGCGTGLLPVLSGTENPINDPDAPTASQEAYPGHDIADAEDYTYSISWVTNEGETAESATFSFGVFPLTDSAVQLSLPVPPPSVLSVNIWRNPVDTSTDRFLLATVAPGVTTYFDLESLAEFEARYNLAMIPPTVNTTGVGALGYLTGYNCYGDGCLTEPPPEQRQDPSPLVDLESGATPPQLFTSMRTVCKECPTGFVNLSTTPLASTLVSSSDAAPEYFIDQLTAGAAIVKRFCARGPAGNGIYNDLKLYGSNSASGPWTTLLEAPTPLYVSANTFACYLLDNVTAFLYYKVEVSSVQYGGAGTIHIDNLRHAEQFYGSAPAQACSTQTAESEISQPHADGLATAAATDAALLLLNCTRLYTQTVIAEAECPPGTFGDKSTVSVTRSSLNSDQEALDWATADAEAEAQDGLDCTGSNNDQAITILDSTGGLRPASPYPSVLFVEDFVGVITKVVVNIFGFSHTFAPDVRLLLVSPSGTAVEILRHSDGVPVGVSAASGLDLVFDDDAVDDFDFITPAAGDFRPTQVGGLTAAFPSPAPQTTPYGTVLSDFDGENPNGSWALYVVDDTSNDVGTISNGWDLMIT